MMLFFFPRRSRATAMPNKYSELLLNCEISVSAHIFDENTLILKYKNLTKTSRYACRTVSYPKSIMNALIPFRKTCQPRSLPNGVHSGPSTCENLVWVCLQFGYFLDSLTHPTWYNDENCTEEKKKHRILIGTIANFCKWRLYFFCCYLTCIRKEEETNKRKDYLMTNIPYNFVFRGVENMMQSHC